MPVFIVRAIWSKLGATLSRGRRDAELNDKIESHLALLAADFARRGMSAREAEEAAKREFGGVERTKQVYREGRGLNLIENAGQDLRLAVRALSNNRGFACVAIGSLAIGIGANASIFSVVRALKFRALPVPRPQELVQVRSFSPEYKTYAETFSYPFVKELANQDMFRSTAATFPTSVSLYDGRETSQIAAELVTGEYFRTLEVKPALGRLLTSRDMNSPGGDSVCTISYSLWQSRFGGRANVLDQSVLLNGR